MCFQLAPSPLRFSPSIFLHLLSNRPPPRTEDYASVSLTVLLSLIICPSLQRVALNLQALHAQAEIERAESATKRGVIYYKLDVRVLGRLGLTGDILRTLTDNGLHIMDCRMDSQEDLAVYEARTG